MKSQKHTHCQYAQTTQLPACQDSSLQCPHLLQLAPSHIYNPSKHTHCGHINYCRKQQTPSQLSWHTPSQHHPTHTLTAVAPSPHQQEHGKVKDLSLVKGVLTGNDNPQTVSPHFHSGSHTLAVVSLEAGHTPHIWLPLLTYSFSEPIRAVQEEGRVNPVWRRGGDWCVGHRGDEWPLLHMVKEKDQFIEYMLYDMYHSTLGKAVIER